LKTDLWDEAKNSRILHWAADLGATVYGLDISSETLGEAQSVFLTCPVPHDPRFIISDVQKIGFVDNCFDYIYSMGTVEHSPDYYVALEECFRVLKSGGRAIIGVPNKLHRVLLIALFARLYRRFPRLRSHGYLIASVVEKP
jgi:ubiquinone/menaquinone biosynthesis C-methylase UbiE